MTSYDMTSHDGTGERSSELAAKTENSGAGTNKRGRALHEQRHDSTTRHDTTRHDMTRHDVLVAINVRRSIMIEVQRRRLGGCAMADIGVVCVLVLCFLSIVSWLVVLLLSLSSQVVVVHHHHPHHHRLYYDHYV